MAPPPPGNPQPILILAGEYPRSPNSIVDLRVQPPTPAYMLAASSRTPRRSRAI